MQNVYIKVDKAKICTFPSVMNGIGKLWRSITVIHQASVSLLPFIRSNLTSEVNRSIVPNCGRRP